MSFTTPTTSATATTPTAGTTAAGKTNSLPATMLSSAPVAQGTPRELAAALVEHIEGHEHGRRGDGVGVWFSQQSKRARNRSS